MKNLTKREEELMKLFWEKGALFVKEIIDLLDEPKPHFNTISTIAVIGMLAVLFLGHMETKLSGIGLSMMVSGGIGNMIDRVAFGEVVDFIDFSDIGFSAIFNVADSIVCIGAGILVLALILDIARESKKKKEKAPTEEDGASGDAK